MRFDVKHPLPHYQLSGPTKDGAFCAPFQWNHSPHGLKGFIRSRQGWAWKSHKTWCARVFGGSMEGFEHPGSKQETKILPWWERSTLVLITFYFFVLITLQRKCPCLLFLQRQIHWGRIYIRACSSIEDIVLWSLLLWDREINKYGVSGIVWQQNLFFSYLNDSMILCLHTHAYYYISFFQYKSRQF